MTRRHGWVSEDHGTDAAEPQPAYIPILGANANEVRMQQQAKIVQGIGCIAHCGNVQMIGAVRAEDTGEGLNARVRCPLCLTGYELTPEGEVVNITRPAFVSYTLDQNGGMVGPYIGPQTTPQQPGAFKRLFGEGKD